MQERGGDDVGAGLQMRNGVKFTGLAVTGRRAGSFSRCMAGWTMRHTMECELPLEALLVRLPLAVRIYGLLDTFLHHPDRAAQYVRGDYRRRLDSNAMPCGIRGGSDCRDKPRTDSFAAMLKNEVVSDASAKTREKTRAVLTEYFGP